MNARWLIPACALIAGIGAGLYVGVKISKPKTTLETPLPEVRQIDGSLVLERKPDPTAKPKHMIPKGATVSRIMSATIQPRNDSELPNIPELLKPVTVDMSLVVLPDQTMRVIASSPDGEVTGGIDIPVQPYRFAPQYKNAAGVTLGHGLTGLWYNRTWRRVVVGCEVRRTVEGVQRVPAWDGTVRFGVTF